MPLSTNKPEQNNSEPIKNCMYHIGFTKNLINGKIAEGILFYYLSQKDFQVHPILHHKCVEPLIEYGGYRNEGTFYCPDFLVNTSEAESFFADAKCKTEMKDLGVINKSDYHKYCTHREKSGSIGFKLYFIIKENKGIWVMDNLVDENTFPNSIYDRNVCQIPKEYLKPLGNYSISKDDLRRYVSGTGQFSDDLVPVIEQCLASYCPEGAVDNK